jgi:hypothetical protein
MTWPRLNSIKIQCKTQYKLNVNSIIIEFTLSLIEFNLNVMWYMRIRPL